jgi:molybdopterin-guanine dinucleotide biosynthesis protein B
MRIVTVVGSKKGGKTTVVCELVRQLRASGHKVATVKLMERARGIDISDTETDLHRRAGANLTIASGTSETAILKNVERRENLRQILGYIPHDIDFVVCEGIADQDLPRVVAVRDPSDIDAYINERTIAISGIAAARPFNHVLPVIDVTRNPQKLADLVRSLPEKS